MPDLPVPVTPEAVVLTEESPDGGKTINVELHSENDFPADHREPFSLLNTSAQKQW
jgi:hypothetical protein